MELVLAALEANILEYDNTCRESNSESTDIHYGKAFVFGKDAPGGTPVVAEHVSRFCNEDYHAKQMPLIYYLNVNRLTSTFASRVYVNEQLVLNADMSFIIRFANFYEPLSNQTRRYIRRLSSGFVPAPSVFRLYLLLNSLILPSA